MADEIREITRDPLKHGLVRFTVLYYYALAEPVETLGHVVVALTPRSTLPPEVATYEVLSEYEMAALDAGESCYRIESLPQEPGQTLADVLAVSQRRYTKGFTWIAGQRARYANLGRTHDAAGG